MKYRDLVKQMGIDDQSALTLMKWIKMNLSRIQAKILPEFYKG